MAAFLLILLTQATIPQAGLAEVTFAEVETREDLNAYAQSAIGSNDFVEAISFTEDLVEVGYKQKGIFLALWPIEYSAKVRVSADGRVETEYPWYSVLALDGDKETKAELQIAVDTALRERLVGSVVAEGEDEHPKFTPAESAMVAAQVIRVLAEL